MSHRTWMHRLSRVIVLPLAKTPVTPNQLTALRLATGVGAALLFALGETWHVHGAAAFIVSMLLDRADGELARMTGRTTPWGHTFDLVSDGICNAVVFVGVGVGARGGMLGLGAVPVGILAGLAVAAILWLVIRVEARQGARAAELGGFGGFDPDDAMLAVPVAMLLGWSDALLVAAGIGAPLFALFMFVRFQGGLGPEAG